MICLPPILNDLNWRGTKLANAIIIKPNQMALLPRRLKQQNGKARRFKIIVSHRPAKLWYRYRPFGSHLFGYAVYKSWRASKSRMAKYNELLKIESELWKFTFSARRDNL